MRATDARIGKRVIVTNENGIHYTNDAFFRGNKRTRFYGRWIGGHIYANVKDGDVGTILSVDKMHEPYMGSRTLLVKRLSDGRLFIIANRNVEPHKEREGE